MKLITALLLGSALLAAGCERAQQSPVTAAHAPGAEPGHRETPLTTYKSATCGCCKLWVDHAKDQGFQVKALDVDDLNAVKNRFDIAPQLQSCHTSVSANDYVFEGHVPAKFIRQFLQKPPANARGLAVPAMPLGSPGMEVGDRFTPYDVVLLHKDGGHSVYARIENAEQQF
ncbi:DUF411 domain-containing protein [Microbulbifer elongatus]|uniref:DUF411 domain-containing protein n=1 Tax=Microbulbifer elongatus TaxID=86173 RepID=A0ABT1P421_9GAMM|nr:DUF411 domain-containing protein [Microbulbifer elongatus]MCQ3830853.1 DUF411 domain-containing protein [Microbulbifer elongatus]